MTLLAYVILGLLLFSIGAITVLVRRSILISLMGIELMLNAANLVLVTFARLHSNIEGQVMAFFIIIVAAAEVVVGLAIVVSVFRSLNTTSIDDLNELKK